MGKTVTVLDLKYGTPQLTIDTSIEVYGLRSIENTVVVIGDEKAIAWDLPEWNYLPGVRIGVRNSTRSIKFRNVDDSLVFTASISLDFQHIALARYDGGLGFLDVYSTSTGRNFCAEADATAVWFAPSGHDV